MNKKFIFLACVLILLFSLITVSTAVNPDSNTTTITKAVKTTNAAHVTNNVKTNKINKKTSNSGLDTSNSVTTKSIGEKNTSQTSKTKMHTDTTASMNESDTSKTEKSINKVVTSRNVKEATANPTTWDQFTSCISGCSANNLTIKLNKGVTYNITSNFAWNNANLKNLTIIGNGATFVPSDIDKFRFMEIKVNNSVLSISNVTFEGLGRQSQEKDPVGGVIKLSGQYKSSLTISNCTFNNSRARNGGVLLIEPTRDINYKSTLILNNTNVFNTYTSNNGGAISTQFTDLTVDNCNFTNNTAKLFGGSIRVASGKLKITNSVFDDSKTIGNGVYGSMTNGPADYGGSAVHICSFAEAYIANNTFKNCWDVEGGTISFHKGQNYHYDDGLITVVNNTFYNNTAAYGAAIALYTKETDFIIENNSFINNTAIGRNETSSANGGAIWINSIVNDLELNNNTYENNSATNKGGAIYSEGNVTSINQTFKANNATNGGAIYSNGDFVGIEDVYENNSAVRGGAVYLTNTASVISTDGTFKNNKASEYGGVFYIDDEAKFESNYDVCDNNTALRGGVFYINSLSNLAIESSGSIYTNNSATEYGGVIYLENGLIDSEDESYINNTAQYGGAIYNYGGTVDSINNRLENNTAVRGGAVYNCENGIIVKKEGNDCNNSAEIGGAIYNLGTLTSDGSNFTDNHAVDKGGAIYNGGTATVNGDTFKNNNATSGGAVYNLGNFNAEDNTFVGNNATNGGAVLDNGTIQGTENKYYNNTALENGGAVYSCKDRQIVIENIEFKGNKAGQNGGAIYTEDNVLITSSDEVLFENNTAVLGGAVYLNNNSNMTTSGDIYKSNNADYGGAIYTYANNTITVKDTTSFESNNAINGGAIYLSDTTSLTTVESTFKNNNASNGSAVYASGGSNVTSKTTTYANNTADYGTIYADENVNLKTTNDKFTNNTATEEGGAIYSKSDVNSTSSTYTENSAKYGGAISIDNAATLYSNDDEFTSNNADYGGAISLSRNTQGNITGSTFTENNATAGGAIYVFPNVNVNSSSNVFNKNNATEGGVYYVQSEATVNSTGDTFTSNTATNGGVYYNGGNVTSTNSEYRKNTAENGGVIYNIDGGIFTSDEDNFSNNNATEGAVIYNVGNATFVKSTLDSNKGTNSVIVNNNILNMTENDVLNNYVTSDDGAVIYYNTESSVIVNNLFVNNTDNTRDMLMKGTFPVTINENKYIDNYLNDTWEVPEIIEISPESADTYVDIDLNLSAIYNDTIRNGTVYIYDADVVVGEGAVVDGEAHVRIYKGRLSDTITPVKFKYVSLSKHYQNMTATSKIVLGKETIISITPIPNQYVDDEFNVTVTLYNSTYGRLTNADVIIYIGDTRYEEHIGEDGNVTITGVKFDKFGLVHLNATFEGNETHRYSTTKETVRIVKIPTHVELTLPTNDVKHPDDEGDVIITLYDSRDNSIISGRPVSLFIRDHNVTDESFVTDDNGQIVYRFKANETFYNTIAGGSWGNLEFETYVNFTADDKYLSPESAVGSLLVEKYHTHFHDNVTYKQVGTEYKYNVNFTLYDEDHKIVANKEINYTDKDGLVFDENTNINGVYVAPEFTLGPDDDVTLSIFCIENYKYRNSTLPVHIKTAKFPSWISVIPTNTIVNQTNSFTIHLSYSNNIPLTGKINLTVGEFEPVEVEVINGMGYYTNESMVWHNLSEWTVKVEYLGDEENGIIGSSAEASFKVFRLQTNTTVEVLQTLDTDTKFQIHVTSDETPIPINYGNVTVRIIPMDENGPVGEVIVIRDVQLTDGYSDVLSTSDLEGYYRFRLNITYETNDVFISSHEYTPGILLKQYKNTTIEIERNSPILVGEPETIIFTLKDQDGTRLAYKELNITINGTDIKDEIFTTDEYGRVIITTSFNQVGVNNITASFEGDVYYNKSSNLVDLTVRQKTVTTISVVSPIDVSYDIKLNITLKMINGTVLSNQPVDIVYGEYQETINTDENGMITIEGKKFEEWGTKIITATFKGTEFYFPSEDNGEIQVRRLQSILNVTAKSPVYVGNTTKIEGYLTMPDGTPISGAKVYITVNGAEEPVEKTTDDDGYYSYDYKTKTEDIGISNVTVVFNSNGTYNGFTDETHFVVKRYITEINVTANRTLKVGNQTYITGTLQDQFGNNLTNQIVNITIGDQKVHARTDENGTYHYLYHATQSGIYDIKVEYLGNETHMYSYDTYQIKVEKILTHVDIIVDSPVKVGDTVTITGRLFDEYDNDLDDKTLILKVNGTVYETKHPITTDIYGKFHITYKADVLDIQNFTIEYAGDYKYENTNNTCQCHVETYITHFDNVLAENVEIGHNTIVSGLLIDERGHPLRFVDFNITFNEGEPVKYTTDGSGRFSVPYNSTFIGLNNVTLSYVGNYSHEPTEFNTTFMVDKDSVYIDYNLTHVQQGNTTINVTLTDEDGNPVPNGTVVVYYDEDGRELGNGTVNENGTVMINLDLDVGVHDIIIHYNGTDDKYEATNRTITVNVPKIGTSTTFETPEIIKIGDEASVTGILKDEYGNKLANANITVKVGSIVVNTTTDENGKYSVNVTPKTIGVKDVVVSFAGNSTHEASSNTGSILVDKLDTVVTSNVTSPVKVGDNAVITGVLKDQKNRAIPNANITVTVNGKKITTKTDANGKYTVKYPTTTAGINKVTVNYAGDAKHYPINSNRIFTVEKLNTVISVNDLSTSTVGKTTKVTGTLKDENGKAVPNAKVKVKYGNTTKTVTTNSKGAYTASIPNIPEGNNNVRVTFAGNDKYHAATAITTQLVTKVATIVTVSKIKGIVGEKITLTAKVTDIYGNKITGGNLVFKLNGKTLRKDYRFDSKKAPLKFNIKNGKATVTLIADLYLRNAKHISATYSGTSVYERNTSAIVDAVIEKRRAKVKVAVKPTSTKQNQNIVFTATVKDVTKNHKNKTSINQDGYVHFKLNGHAIKDSKGHVIHIPVSKGKATYTYHVPSGQEGVYGDKSIKKYRVTAVYSNKNFVHDKNCRADTTYTVKRSPITVKITKATVKNNKLSIKGTIKDYQNNYVKGTNKVCVKVNGATYRQNGVIKYFKVKNGVINISGLKVDKAITSVGVVSGDRQAYLEGRGSTTKITIK